jgi:hypothetical protein
MRRRDAVPRGPYHATPIFAARSEGATIEDVIEHLLILPGVSAA